ncbi:MAG: LptF/LptG family permease [Deltaproteobacteria bacterium]
MRILDRYIFRSIISIFLLCMVMFVFLYVVIDLFSHLDVILKFKTSSKFLLQYYASYLPLIFCQIAPFSCLIATLYAFARLNNDNEIIAMRSSGISIFGISRTVLLFGLMISCIVFLVSDKVMPRAMQMNQKLQVQLEAGVRKPKLKDEVLKNVSIYGLKNRLYFINKFIVAKKEIEGITILQQDNNQNITKKIVANRGVYSSKGWTFYQVITYSFDRNGQLTEDPSFMEEALMPIQETPEDFLDQRQSPDLMTIDQISNYVWRLSSSGATSAIRNLRIDLYHRLLVPFSSLIIILLAIPFSLKIRKKATGLSSLGLSLVLGFLYYVGDAVCLALGKADVLYPLLSASLTHLVALSLGIYLITKIP